MNASYFLAYGIGTAIAAAIYKLSERGRKIREAEEAKASLLDGGHPKRGSESPAD